MEHTHKPPDKAPPVPNRRTAWLHLILLIALIAAFWPSANPSPERPAAGAALRSLAVPPGVGILAGVPTSSHRDVHGAGFYIHWNDACEMPPDGAQTALAYAAATWGSLISSTVPIELSACWSSALNCDGDALACGGPTQYLRNFSGAPLVDTHYPVALANALSGADLRPEGAEITLQFKAGADWSFDTGLQAAGEDFVAVALHEIAHGLGFTGNMYESYNVGFCGDGPYGFLYPCPTPYDWFVVDSAGVPLLDSRIPDPRVLGARLKSDANFGGPNTLAANAGATVKLYTPPTWVQGSSLSHLDPAALPSGENPLMLPSYSGIVRQPGPLVLAMLQDMGWPRAGEVLYLTTTGPPVATVGQTASFAVTLHSPAYAGQPIIYTWHATGLDLLTHPGTETTDAATFTWTTPGLKTITVTAELAGETAHAVRTLTVTSESIIDKFLFLPLLLRPGQVR